MSPERLDRAFFTRPTAEVAEAMVGCGLYRRTGEGLVAGTIVETEAYGGPEDAASHAAIYPRSRTAVMASRPGTVYVYRSYGIHSCMNIVARPEGGVGAVLIRAVEPTEGLDLMSRRRGASVARDLCRGPGRLCQAFAVDLSDAMTDVVSRADLWLTRSAGDVSVAASPRTGITRAVDVPWRFYQVDSAFVSPSRGAPA